jgi:hypothetical protein
MSPFVRIRNSRHFSWIKAARRAFEAFPEDVQRDMFDALTVAAEGGKSDKAKPFKGIDGGVFEIALRSHGRLSLDLCRQDRRGHLGNPRIPEEIEIRNQNPAGGS